MSDNGTSRTAHLERIEPGTAPGTLYVRIVTDNGVVLAAHPLELNDCRGGLVPGQAVADQRMMTEWLDRNPAETVRNYIYDGDDGHCMKTIIMHGERERYRQKSRP